MPFSDSPLKDHFREFFLFLTLFLIVPFLVFAQQPIENQEVLSKVLEHLKAHYFRLLNAEELQVKSLNELFSKLDEDTHLEPMKPSDLDFIRGLKAENSIAKATHFKNHLGYVRISFLGRRTAEDFDKILDQFGRNGVSNLILDLRGNQGGSLVAGIGIVEHFVPSGNLLFTFYGRNGQETKEYSKGIKTESFKLTVLVDRQTASTAEMIADALRRYAHAQLIGEPTYGKRSVQEAFPIDPYHVLFLTVGHFILPEDSQKKIQPDIQASSKESFEKALGVMLGEKSELSLIETEVSEGKAVQAAAAPQL